MSGEETKKTLPDNEEQLSLLEASAADLANKGYDVKEASVILDKVRVKLETKKPEDAVAVNEQLNQVRTILYYAEFRYNFSCTKRPYSIILYEVAFISLWIWLGFHFYNEIKTIFSPQKWTLLQSLYVCFPAGSIGAASFTLYGVYTHMSHRNMEPAFIPWYLTRPIVGGIMGAFLGLTSTVILNGLNANGEAANLLTFGVAFLAGSNEKFTAEMLTRFTSKVLGVGEKSGPSK